MQQDTWERLDRCALRAGGAGVACTHRLRDSRPRKQTQATGPSPTLPRSATRDALFSAARAVELLLLQELAAANRRRLLDFCRRLQVQGELVEVVG